MPEHSPLFKTPEGQAEYLTAYNATLQLWPIPYEDLYIPTRYGKTHAIASGPRDAPPLILLHAASASATMWFPSIADLSRNHRTYALDTIGDAGKSTLTHQPQDKSDYAKWVTDILNELNIKQTDAVGLSYGGWITLNLALNSSDRVRKIVLLSPANAFTPFSKMMILRILPSMILPIRFLIERSIRILFAKETTPNKEYFNQLALAAEHHKLKMIFPTTFTDKELQQIHTPTLLLIGEEEVILPNPQASIDRATRLMPNATAKIIPNANHMLNQDRPQVVNTHILEFLEG
jgi:pimeloyl-ACP methyl ester carboxylesterase